MLKTIFRLPSDQYVSQTQRVVPYPQVTRRYIAPRSHRSHQPEGCYYLFPNMVYDCTHKCDIAWSISKHSTNWKFISVNEDLRTIENWAAQWGVTFNPSKTVYKIMSKKLKRPPPVNLYLNCKQINRVQYYWCLGLSYRHTSQMYQFWIKQFTFANFKVPITKFKVIKYH